MGLAAPGLVQEAAGARKRLNMRPDSENLSLAIYRRFGRKWGISPEMVEEIYRLAKQRGYGRTRRLVLLFWRLPADQVPSVRQIRYMVRVLNLSRRFGTDAANYRDVVLRKA